MSRKYNRPLTIKGAASVCANTKGFKGARRNDYSKRCLLLLSCGAILVATLAMYLALLRWSLQDRRGDPQVDDTVVVAPPPPPSSCASSALLPADTALSSRADILSALSFLLPPAQRRCRLMEKINEVLRFGTRVAGSFTPGHRKMRNLFAAEARWQPPRRALFNAALAQLPASHWLLEWDNFTTTTPFGRRQFFNAVFRFRGGNAFLRKIADGNVPPREAVDAKERQSFAAADGRTMASTRLQHIVLSAHWDSKYFSEFEFLGACDAVVPVVYLLETMRLIGVLSDTVMVAGVREDDGNVCTRLREALSPAYLSLLQYHYADDDDTIRCLSGQPTGAASLNASSPHGGGGGGGGWVRLLQQVAHLPAISVVLFDGEEAFLAWRGTDHTYGSRHLAEQWKKRKSTGWSTDAASSLFDSIDLFALYDLMGPAGTQFHNLFPDQSGIAFSLLAEVEKTQRARAKRLWHVLSRRTWTTTKGAREDESCAQHLPLLWCRHGPPHELFTLHGIPHPASTPQHRTDLAAPSAPPDSRNGTDDDDDDDGGGGGGGGGNIFFPLWQISARGPKLDTNLNVADDHIHWMDTQRVLHLIALPFPSSWHTQRDDGSELDAGTTIDLFRVLAEFTLRLGEGWMLP